MRGKERATGQQGSRSGGESELGGNFHGVKADAGSWSEKPAEPHCHPTPTAVDSHGNGSHPEGTERHWRVR